MLKEAVDSTLKQSYEHVEIIIVDDGSTDETKQTADALANDHTNIKCIRTAKQGPGPARQAGLDQAIGEYVQYLDSDDLLLPEKLKQQVAFLENEAAIDVVYCQQSLTDLSANLIEHHWMRTGERHLTMFPAMLGGRIWGTAVPLYRRTLLNMAGPWKALSNFEDWEYDCRVAIHANKLAYVEQNLVNIRRHQEEHYGSEVNRHTNKLIDRTTALKLIASHADTANIKHEHLEYKKFIRFCFFTCRQNAKAGLKRQAQELLVMINKFSANSLKHKCEYHSYYILSQLLGWQFMGKISAQFDRLRSVL